MPVAGASRQFSRNAGSHPIRVGFVRLIDAAPLIIASKLGYFSDEGIDVSLEMQIGWGNVRDRLSYGQLHASHAPLGMAPASVAAMDYYDTQLAVLMGLGSGGNAITVASPLAMLTDGVNSPSLWRRHLGRSLNLAYVFAASTHHYLLRELLHQSGLRPDHDAALCVMPPPQLVGLLQSEAIDGFCAGEPWNTLAVMGKRGTIVCATTELIPNHPEKVLAVTRKWYASNTDAAERLVRATLRGCDYCEDIANRSRLTEILAREEYLNLDENVIARSLSIEDWLKPGVKRPAFRSFSRASTVPSTLGAEWILRQMIRWGHLPLGSDVPRIANESVITAAYDSAVASMPSVENKPSTRTVLQGSLS